ncbi:glycosyltransferase family 2 protein [Pedobacter sp. 22226]|uniref:glycosyltransferase family 2 protein n=1 Tax=Pedobacter sp. 22226 TaxID=3453894 RepID=UPI003F82DA51
MDVSIIIVNYNTKFLTRSCIDSLINNTSDIKYEIILVDNASTDGSKEEFSEMSDITFIPCKENLGFGRANNLGSESASGEFLFFLNSDTLLTENSIKKLFDFFVENERTLQIGSLGCVLIDKKGNFNGDGSEFPTCKSEILNYKYRTPILKFFKKNKDYIKSSMVYSAEFYPIGYVIGADLMMRKTVFDKLHGFDPRFFMYYEESDLQFRMKKMGFESYIYTGTKIIHLEDGSGKQIKKYNNRKRIIVHTSKNIYLKKNDPDNFPKFKLWDQFYLYLSRLNPNYTLQEKRDFEIAVKKTY